MKIIVRIKQLPFPLYFYLPLFLLKSKTLFKKMAGKDYNEHAYILIKNFYKELKNYLKHHPHFELVSIENEEIEVKIKL